MGYPALASSVRRHSPCEGACGIDPDQVCSPVQERRPAAIERGSMHLTCINAARDYFGRGQADPATALQFNSVDMSCTKRGATACKLLRDARFHFAAAGLLRVAFVAERLPVQPSAAGRVAVGAFQGLRLRHDFVENAHPALHLDVADVLRGELLAEITLRSADGARHRVPG